MIKSNLAKTKSIKRVEPERTRPARLKLVSVTTSSSSDRAHVRGLTSPNRASSFF